MRKYSECQNFGKTKFCDRWILDNKEKLEKAVTIGNVILGEKIEVPGIISIDELKKADEICKECCNFEQK
ncbi:hypothetical protein KAI68_04870 [bacterium]|nr:hypothetical protein [bacterium]